MTVRRLLTSAAPRLVLPVLVMAGLVLAAQPLAARSRLPLWQTAFPLGKPGAEAKPGAVTVRGGGVAVQFEPANRTAGTGEDGEAVPATRITVIVPGYPALAVPADTSRLDEHGIKVGIGRLAPGAPAPSVILAGYSGGAHCCATFQLVTPVDGALRVLDLPGINGGPERAFPRDLDGDGTVDFLRQDDRFRYQFTDGAGSWSPPVIFNLADGALADVSSAPRYAPLWRKFAARTLAACADGKNPGRNGACAAHAAAQARLGQGETGIAAAVRLAAPSDWLPDSCTVDLVDEACPEGSERSFAGFEEALRWFLKAQGYL